MKQNPTIYKIDKSFVIDKVHGGIREHLNSNHKKFVERDLKLNDFDALLIVIESDEKESEWSDFFPNEFIKGISFNFKIPSLLLIVKTSVGIFSIVGGGFYKYLLPFLDMSYGLNTYARIMSPTKDQIITIKTRGVTGLRAGMQEQFKDNYRIIDYIKFGKIPVEMKIKLDNRQAELFFNQFVTSRSSQIILNISSGFNINKKLSFDELGDLIKILVYIESIKPNDFFSSYKEITNKELISKSLKPGIINELFNKRNEIIQNKVSNFDLCYPNKIEDFYSADEYEIKLKLGRLKFKRINVTNDKGEILKLILEFLKQNGHDNNLKNFNEKILNIYIYTYKSQKSTPILKTALIYHINTELSLRGIGTFIYLDSKWYKLREIFIKEMNTRCSEILQSNNLSNIVLNEVWDKKVDGKRISEYEYNKKYLKQNYLVLDTLTVDSIELADVIYINEDAIYLCHIKYGFSAEMRELYSQIVSSARRLKNDLKDDQNSYLKLIFSKLNNINNGGLTEEQFILLFKEKNIKYVMSFTAHLKNKKLPNYIELYKSNVAKLSLIQCFTEMRTEYFDLDIEVINNSGCF
ncbi:MAG: DUF6119 family protein [Cytophaga sp.]|uniref:DUF6119 family protein n=1 Tax=Cytophaga sp. TaxID=29535 RepID=UPI003F80C056